MAFRIYLAGPDVFFPEPLAVARAHRAVLARYGLEGVFPLDNEIVATTPRAMAREIFAANCRLIETSDGMIANMMPFRGPSTDVGTAWEIGYAHALKKPVVGYAEDLSEYRAKVFAAGHSAAAEATHDARGHAIEHFELTDNLMITECLLAQETCLEKAAERLALALGTR